MYVKGYITACGGLLWLYGVVLAVGGAYRRLSAENVRRRLAVSENEDDVDKWYVSPRETHARWSSGLCHAVRCVLYVPDIYIYICIYIIIGTRLPIRIRMLCCIFHTQLHWPTRSCDRLLFFFLVYSIPPRRFFLLYSFVAFLILFTWQHQEAPGKIPVAKVFLMVPLVYP